MKDFFGIGWGTLSAVLIFASGYPYMRAIYKRELERPVISTWILWLGIGILLFVTNWQAGANWSTTLLPIMMGVINPTIIVILSVRYGEYKWSNRDTWCVVLCVITVIVWQVTQSPLLGTLGGVTADAIAATPLVIKSWEDPKDEPAFPWAMFVIGSAVNMLAIVTWEMKLWLFPVYMTVMGFILLLPLLLYRFKLFKFREV